MMKFLSTTNECNIEIGLSRDRPITLTTTYRPRSDDFRSHSRSQSQRRSSFVVHKINSQVKFRLTIMLNQFNVLKNVSIETGTEAGHKYGYCKARDIHHR
jgi:hypothetical protein